MNDVPSPTTSSAAARQQLHQQQQPQDGIGHGRARESQDSDTARNTELRRSSRTQDGNDRDNTTRDHGGDSRATTPEADAAAETESGHDEGENSSSSRRRDRDGPSPEEKAAKERRKMGLVRKMKFLGHLMKTLDIVFMAEVCALYYMECSFFCLALRCFPHFLFLTPKADNFFIHIPAQRTHVFAIFVPNFVCAFVHLVLALPRASEATRGYLHGGIIIDFVGQQAPTSRLGLLALDLVILAVQCIMLTVHQEREGLRRLIAQRSGRGNNNTGGAESTGADAEADAVTANTMPSTQDHDAEERGVLRDAPNIMVGAEDIELQPLYERDGADESCDNFAQSAPRHEAADLTDILRSGNATLADLHIVHAIRTAGNTTHNATAYSLQSLGYSATIAAMAAESRARVEAQRRQR